MILGRFVANRVNLGGIDMRHRPSHGKSGGGGAKESENPSPGLDPGAGMELDRRTFIALTGGAGLALTASRVIPARAQSRARIGDPFTLGVASGDPLPDSVVLWTRLAPDPFSGDGGMPQRPVPVQWQIALDDRMTRVVRSGSRLARPQLGHSVHVEVSGLDPARWYWYRFRTQGHLSPVGRTRTAPSASSSPEALRLAFASCQNFPQGFYAAYRDIAEQDLDLVLHLGDYIYEGAAQGSLGRGHVPAKEVSSLGEYRIRYSQYKSDPHLQAAHAAAPFLATFDDHEVDNNWAGDVPQDPEQQPREEFLARRAAAFQAFYEHQPLRRSALPDGPDMLAYRRSTFGDLAQFSVLDTRQHRSDQPCDDGIKERCPTALDPDQTMTGPEQERWLLDGLGRSTARWNVITQQVYMVEYKFVEDNEDRYNMDKWDGYVAARNRILGFVHQNQVSNPIVLSGDVHAHFANDIKDNFEDPDSMTLASEFVGTSISSRKGNNARFESALPHNPHVKYYNGRQRGYVRCEVTPQHWRTDHMVVEDVTDPQSPVLVGASFLVEDGRPGVHVEDLPEVKAEPELNRVHA